MPPLKQVRYTKLLKDFKESMSRLNDDPTPRLILIIMANTHDSLLSKECEHDAKKIRSIFKNISEHFKFNFSSIEISGNHYHYDKLDKAIDSIQVSNENDVILFYYSGHGFSYKNDRINKYPQLDMRPHNKQVRHNKINFIKEHTVNLEAILNILRFRGCRVNIAIADCCNTTIPFKRSILSERDMDVSRDILPAKSKTLTKEIFTDEDNDISIIVSSSQLGQPAITESGIGSIFTHFFTEALSAVLTTKPKGEAYIPWVRILKKTYTHALKESKGYDIGGGIPGKQKAVFQVYVGTE
jgi:hypothetical protein